MPVRHVLLPALALLLPGLAHAEQVTVFAAASLKNAMDDIVASYQAQSGHSVVVSLAGSSALAKQIQQGAPADIFISANPDWMDLLKAEGLLEDGSRRDLLGNSLVLVAHGTDAAPVTIGPDLDLPALLGEGRLAMALVDSVPAGIYGKAALDHLGLWQEVAPSVAQSDNVRAALALVATGEAPFGIVYATDAGAEDRVTVAGHFPADSHPPILYPVADLANRDSAAEEDFLTYLQGAEARAAFEAQGFTVLAD
ncbi:molybdate ABC transporter substrate-binding protein [Salipiger marinus]|uniref:molybdate ABC transporter substrate-binding protein n=1 Tax=Salipiger marinus TaxID=555512 RepID=UPI001E4AAA10|nr:molybdate ABC transporter substrate-binding protein [Salipiger manganoxidans]MCD1617248.1 molybdate ABC transporter substrate-binding protein [Salipiger manganoxidans]MEB3417295.1 molybdate ABC transporter substrate-binding protein [Salipiger manganoxidans]